AQELKVGTFNVVFMAPIEEDIINHPDGWYKRGAAVCDLINFYDFDVVGLQEVRDMIRMSKGKITCQTYNTLTQLDSINRRLVDSGKYDLVLGSESHPIAQDAEREFCYGGYNPIYFKKDHYQAVDSGSFWFTPDGKPGLTFGETDKSQSHMCTWAKLKDRKTNVDFFVFNTHATDKQHVKVAQRLIDKINELAVDEGNTNVILIGDYNIWEDLDGYKMLANRNPNVPSPLRDTYYEEGLSLLYHASSTPNQFQKWHVDGSRIDHVLIGDGFKALQHFIITDVYFEGESTRHISDHYPVLAKLQFKGGQPQSDPEGRMVVSSYNVASDAGSDGYTWRFRFPVINKILQLHNADVIGLQEMNPSRVHNLRNDLSDYTFVFTDLTVPILYKKNKFKVNTSSSFNLPGSSGICFWVKLTEIATSYSFYVFNAHLYKSTLEGQYLEASFFLQDKISEIVSLEPVVVTGSFPFNETNSAYLDNSCLLQDSYQNSPIRYKYNYEGRYYFETGPLGLGQFPYGRTVNDFRIDFVDPADTDHIFTSQQFTTVRHGVVSTCYFWDTEMNVPTYEFMQYNKNPERFLLHFPSNHFPVIAEFEYCICE
ncbi:MAG: endonuclease/exonuclease/phosphatase family protein, partial [Bacteroidales bacterium]|nr:endonuclease/exonuclease/phosphatase family protein [Bacteroidales bacterium]